MSHYGDFYELDFALSYEDRQLIEARRIIKEEEDRKRRIKWAKEFLAKRKGGC